MSLRSGAFSRERLGRMAEVMRGYVDRGEVAGVVTLLCRHGPLPDPEGHDRGRACSRA